MKYGISFAIPRAMHLLQCMGVYVFMPFEVGGRWVHHIQFEYLIVIAVSMIVYSL